MSNPESLTPGQPVPVAGTYEECNLFGTRTGFAVRLAAGHALPPSPANFTWRLVQPETLAAADVPAPAGEPGLPDLPAVLPTTELRRLAEQLIAEHGDEALNIISRELPKFEAAGNQRAARVWGDIKHYVRQLQSQRAV